MNFAFEVGDIVVFTPRNKRREDGVEMELVREFVRGVFHAKLPDGRILRVRTQELIRVRRPSDEIKRAQVEERKKAKALDLQVRKDRVERNVQEFEHLKEFRIRLTAQGLPDKRCKPRYTAKNSPVIIRTKPRGSLW